MNDNTGTIADRRARWTRVILLIAVFLAVFGIANFLELPLGWKDRHDQVARYLSATVSLGNAWVLPVLWAQKIIEGALGMLALAGALRRDVRLVTASVVGWMAVMTTFTFMDVWAADRGELQEHTVYFGIFALMVMVIAVAGRTESPIHALTGNASRSRVSVSDGPPADS